MRQSKLFGVKSTKPDGRHIKPKYFLVYEGRNTEDIYFNELIRTRDSVRINPIIELVPITRSFGEEGWSNPKKIVDRMVKNLEENRTGCFSYETLCNWVMDYLIDKKFICRDKVTTQMTWEIIHNFCYEELEVRMELDVENLEQTCRDMVEYIVIKLNNSDIITDVSKIIEMGKIDYYENIDKICFVFDRDRKSFVNDGNKRQYDEVVEICMAKRFGLYITNPCFEFWLFLHFPEVLNLDKSKLLDNPPIGSRTYVEDELHRLVNGFDKSNYNASIFIDKIDTAIKNEKSFCEDILELESCVGSNLGLLVEELRKEY